MWVAVGGTPTSVVRAGTLGLPLALAIIGDEPARFAPLADLHRRALAHAGHGPQPLSINSHGFIADTSQAAAEIAFDAASTLHGANFVGSPAEVAEKILYQHELFAHDRFLLQLTVGSLPHRDVMRAIELYGTEVAPAVRAELRSAAESVEMPVA